MRSCGAFNSKSPAKNTTASHVLICATACSGANVFSRKSPYSLRDRTQISKPLLDNSGNTAAPIRPGPTKTTRRRFTLSSASGLRCAHDFTHAAKIRFMLFHTDKKPHSPALCTTPCVHFDNSSPTPGTRANRSRSKAPLTSIESPSPLRHISPTASGKPAFPADEAIPSRFRTRSTRPCFTEDGSPGNRCARFDSAFTNFHAQ